MLWPTSATRDAPVASEDRVDLRGDLIDEELDRFERRAVGHRVDRTHVPCREILRQPAHRPGVAQHAVEQQDRSRGGRRRGIRHPEPIERHAGTGAADRAELVAEKPETCRNADPHFRRTLRAEPPREREPHRRECEEDREIESCRSDDAEPRTRARGHCPDGPRGVQQDAAADDEPQGDRGGHGAGSYLPSRRARRDGRGADQPGTALAFRYGGRARVHRPPPRARS